MPNIIYLQFNNCYEIYNPPPPKTSSLSLRLEPKALSLPLIKPEVVSTHLPAELEEAKPTPIDPKELIYLSENK